MKSFEVDSRWKMTAKRSKQLREILTFILFILLLAGCSLGALQKGKPSRTAVRSVTDLAGGTTLLPSSSPDRSQLIPIGYFTVTVKKHLTGIMLIYVSPDDPRSVKYVELYNQEGKLTLIQWVELPGVTKTAIDSGLLDEDGSRLVGVLRLVNEGDPV